MSSTREQLIQHQLRWNYHRARSMPATAHIISHILPTEIPKTAFISSLDQLQCTGLILFSRQYCLYHHPFYPFLPCLDAFNASNHRKYHHMARMDRIWFVLNCVKRSLFGPDFAHMDISRIITEYALELLNNAAEGISGCLTFHTIEFVMDNRLDSSDLSIGDIFKWITSFVSMSLYPFAFIMSHF